MNIVVGRDEEIAAWVGRHLGIPDMGPCGAIGFADDSDLLAGVVYNNLRDGHVVEGSVASVSPRWCTRSNLYWVFWVPFLYLKCRRFQGLARKKNKHARQFNKRLGFKEEGVLRAAFPDDDGVLYSMLSDECRWLNGGKPIV